MSFCRTVHSRPLAHFHRKLPLNTAYINENRAILISGQLELHVTIGELQVRPKFLVADAVAVDNHLESVIIK